MTTILVTGASGFIGRHLTRVLTERGYTVRSAVRRILEHAGEIVVGNIGPETDWRPALAGCDMAVHLAGFAHFPRSLGADALSAMRETNVGGARSLGEQAAAIGLRRLVYVSSVKVNGDVTCTAPFSRGDAPAPTDHYGSSKAEAELVLAEIAAKSGLELVIIRPALV